MLDLENWFTEKGRLILEHTISEGEGTKGTSYGGDSSSSEGGENGASEKNQMAAARASQQARAGGKRIISGYIGYMGQEGLYTFTKIAVGTAKATSTNRCQMWSSPLYAMATPSASSATTIRIPEHASAMLIGRS